MCEKWHDIPSWVGRYQVSTLGRLKGPRGIMSLVPDKNGYLRTAFSQDGKMHNVYVHRLVCRTFHGPKPFEGALALHRDGVNIHNIPNNLYWGTHAQNVADAIKHGTILTGENHPHNAGLTWEIVREIRRRALTGETAYRLSREFQLSDRHCMRIMRHEIWKENHAKSICAA